MTETTTFSALGTTIECGVRVPSKRTARQLLLALQQQIEAFEKQFSRFRPDSELTRMNRRAGAHIPVSQQMLGLFTTAYRIWQQTDGLVDPTVGNAVIAAGYSMSFVAPAIRSSPLRQRAIRNATMADVFVDVKKRTVFFPRGVALDFGGIGKGYLLDILAPVIEEVTDHYWISLGGDLLVSGYDEDGKPWYVAVQNPHDEPRDLGQIRPPQGRWAFATSGTLKRRGVHNGRPWHHLIDPRTARPATTDLVAVTALAPTGIDAEAVAKSTLLQGSKEGFRWAERQRHVEALGVTAEGNLILTQGMEVLLSLFS